LGSIDVAYHMNHRGGEIGHYAFTKSTPTTGVVVCGDPYPCEFDHGIVEASARKFAPPKVVASVRHDEAQPCRSKHGESCTYHVSW
jgi:hypothetical protein